MRVLTVCKTTEVSATLLTLSRFGPLSFHADADDRTITPGKNQDVLLTRLVYKYPEHVAELLHFVEVEASELFPDFEEAPHWVWRLSTDCNPCKCHNCMN